MVLHTDIPIILLAIAIIHSELVQFILLHSLRTRLWNVNEYVI